MRITTLAAIMLLFALGAKAQNSYVPILKNSKDTVMLYAEILYSAPDYTYFIKNDTVFRLETSKFVNSSGFKHVDSESYAKGMYDAFSQAKTSNSLAYIGIFVGIVSSYAFSGEDMAPFYWTGLVVAAGIEIAAFVYHILFLNSGKRAALMEIAIDYPLN